MSNKAECQHCKTEQIMLFSTTNDATGYPMPWVYSRWQRYWRKAGITKVCSSCRHEACNPNTTPPVLEN